MRIGIPREQHDQEHRVSRRPDGVAALTPAGLADYARAFLDSGAVAMGVTTAGRVVTCLPLGRAHGLRTASLGELAAA